MNRRDLLTALLSTGGCGGIALLNPARAQDATTRKWRIGVLAQKRRQDVLLQGLAELGYHEGSNLVLDGRSNEQSERLGRFAAELVARKPEVVFAAGTQAVQALQQATKSIPIVMIASDPVGNGLVTSLAHPGANITGLSIFSPELSGKRIELLGKTVGQISPLGVLWKPDDPPAATAMKETETAARALQVQLLPVEVRDAEGFLSASEQLAKNRVKALVILNAPLMSVSVERIAKIAASLRLPSIFTDRVYPEVGGLMSYGPSFDALTKRASIYIEKILKGQHPAELPVELPSKFELVVNLTAANGIGLTVPESVLALADEIVD